MGKVNVVVGVNTEKKGGERGRGGGATSPSRKDTYSKTGKRPLKTRPFVIVVVPKKRKLSKREMGQKFKAKPQTSRVHIVKRGN